MNAVATQQPYEVPEGGLASFLTATVGDWSDEALNSDNYYDIVKPTAEQLAAFGREEDDRIAHVATGETIVPMAVFDEDPALKEALFARMRDMGIDPERYVVGNELNSINPVTGQPEFFLKKIVKGIKKAVKGVVKVFKKIAPLVLSIGLNFLVPGLGAIASGALGSGIGTLVQGGSLKDAFKAALIGGAVGGISSGIGSVMKGGEFMAGVKSGLPTGLGGGVNPTLAPKALTAAEQAQTAALEASGRVSEGAAPAFDVTGAEALGPIEMPPQAGAALQEGMAVSPAAAQPDILNQLQSGQFTTDASGAIVSPAAAQPDILNQLQSGQFTTDASGAIVRKAAPPAAPGAETASQAATDAASQSVAGAPTLSELVKATPETFLDKIKEGRFIDAFKGQAGITKDQIIEAILGEEGLTTATASVDKIIEAATKASTYLETGVIAQPGMLAKYGPMTALGLGVAGAAGAFEERPMPPPYDFFGGLTTDDYRRMYPEQYRITPIGRDSQGNLLAAGGGGISNFPRKNGPIQGPGTETSDDIPAMLSDGEFVMTARAVRGAGNGSRKNGMNKMYDMMRTFERNAARG